MTQQTSPFVESKYGWNFGESGWNTGADENWLKFGFLHDNNVEDVVASLPSAVNGTAYFLTTDNRFYFAVGTSWYSSPCPKWFIFKVRSTGMFWQFDGASAVEINNPQQANAALEAIQDVIDTLGTAAFVSLDSLATQAELDVAAADAAAYTDALRSDLASTTTGNGAELVGFKQAGTGAIDKTLQEEFLNIFSVSQFTNISDVDHTAGFQAAADAAPSWRIDKSLYDAVPSTNVSEIIVPAGEWIVSSIVGAGTKNIVWVLKSGAKVTDVNNLQGRVIYEGVRVNAAHHGILDNACSYSVKGNRGNDSPAGVLGITHPNQLSSYSDRDSVGFYYDNQSVIPITVVNATYTATTLICPTPVDVELLKIGMVIDTTHTPNKYSGMVTGWASDGSSVTVSAWYEVTGSTGVAGTPPGTQTAYINAFTKIWAGNSQTILATDGIATKGVGFEMGLRNNKHNPSDPYDADEYMWGHDVINLGTNNCSIGYVQRGAFLHGFNSRGALLASFVASSQGPSVTPPYGFRVTHDGAAPFSAAPDGTNDVFAVSNTGDTVLGSNTYSPGNRVIRFKSGGSTGVSYDARIMSTGGGASDALGTLRFTAQFVESQGRLQPNVDNTHNSGSSTNRWADSYSVRFRPGAGTASWTSGAGSPEGVITASVGSLYARTDGGSNTTLYIKESGSGNTGWVDSSPKFPNGSIELGNSSSTQSFIDMHSSSTSSDYDARIFCSGGSSTAGQGAIRITAATTSFDSAVQPFTDNTRAFGSSTFRWSNAYATQIRPGDGSPIWTSGSGTPEGVVTAVVGSMYTDTSGGAGTTLYVKESGAGNTGWVAK